MKNLRIFCGISAALAACLASGCNSSSVTTNPGPTETSVSPGQLVSQLVSDAQNGSAPSAYAGTVMEKSPTLQGGGFFVVYSPATKQYEVISLQSAENGGLSAQQMAQDYVQADQSVGGQGPFNGMNPISPILVSPDAQQPGLYISGNGNLYSVDGQTKDVDLQQAQVQQSAFYQRAANVSAHYQMSFQSALQLTSLADRLQAASGQAMTNQDRQMVTDSVLKIAGVGPDDLNQAIDASVGGNDSLANNLVSKIAQNLGMPSDTLLRDQILPSLGVSLSQ